MSCLSWRHIFHKSWENKSKFQIGGLRETEDLLLFSPEGRTYSPPRRHKLHILRPAASGRSHPFRCASFSHKVSDFVGALLRQWYFLRKSCALRGGCGCCGQPPDNATAPASAAVIVCAGLSCFRFGNSLRPARTNLPPAALFAAMTRSSTSGHFLFCERETEKERTR